MSEAAWELPEETRLLQQTVRRFMANEVKPIEDRQPHDACGLPPEDLAPLQAKAKALGLWCISTPLEHGGAGLDVLSQMVIAEQAAQCRMGAYFPACGAFGANPPIVIFDGDERQIDTYARPVIESGEKAFVGISEPSGGADPRRAIRTRAERRGDRYVLNGTKLWITGVEGAAWGLVYARMAGAEGTDGITCFIVDPKRKGFTYKPVPVIRAYYPFEIHLEDYEVPVEDRLGKEGGGFKLANKWLVFQRVPYAANVIGIAQAALDLAVDWANNREAFRSTLADKQAVQWMIADSEVEIRAARLLTYQAAWRAMLGHDVKTDASIAKLYATEMAGRVVDRCIQIFGGLGVSKEMPLERWYRELRIKRIGEGPSEVHRMVIARDLLRGPRGG